MDAIKRHSTEPCILDTWEVRERSIPTIHKLPVMSPTEKMDIFLACHDCPTPMYCSESCLDELESFLAYSQDETEAIDRATQGQSNNPNWHIMRKNILTSSVFKKICHSTNQTKTAVALLNGPSFNQDQPPQHIAYGRRFENTARQQFLRVHKYQHSKCHIDIPGLILNDTYPFLGASPDGVLVCKGCPSKSLIEIKCLSSKRNYGPGTALVLNKICTRKVDGSLTIDRSHAYFYQIQGQMALTGIHTCILIGYTNKGITTICVDFDPAFWGSVSQKLTDFYRGTLFPMLRATYVKEVTSKSACGN